jgi:biopolymer transport protein TolR
VRPRKPRPDINVTPLVDVVLVLLIIFMLVVPQLEAGAAVNVPRVDNPDAPVESALGPLVVSVTRSNEIFVDHLRVGREALSEHLESSRAADPERPVLLKGDRGAEYGAVREVLEKVQSLGFPGAALEVSAQDEDAHGGEG